MEVGSLTRWRRLFAFLKSDVLTVSLNFVCVFVQTGDAWSAGDSVQRQAIGQSVRGNHREVSRSRKLSREGTHLGINDEELNVGKVNEEHPCGMTECCWNDIRIISPSTVDRVVWYYQLLELCLMTLHSLVKTNTQSARLGRQSKTLN